jgi:hypothetical protein
MNFICAECKEIKPHDAGNAARQRCFCSRKVKCIEKLMSQMKKIESSGCWEWLGPKNSITGYGTLSISRFGGVVRHVHRVAYTVFVGDIPVGLQIDHMCKNRICFNPSHLEIKTAKLNNLRSDSPSAKNAVKTHCCRGHKFTKENTNMLPGGRRQCKECRRLLDRLYYTKTKRPHHKSTVFITREHLDELKTIHTVSSIQEQP